MDTEDLTTQQAAELLTNYIGKVYSQRTTKIYCQRKIFVNAYKIARDWRIPRSDVLAYAEQLIKGERKIGRRKKTVK